MKLPRIDSLDLRSPDVIEHDGKDGWDLIEWDWPIVPRLARWSVHLFLGRDGKVEKIIPTTIMRRRPITQWYWSRISFALGMTLAVTFDAWAAARLWL